MNLLMTILAEDKKMTRKIGSGTELNLKKFSS